MLTLPINQILHPALNLVAQAAVPNNYVNVYELVSANLTATNIYTCVSASYSVRISVIGYPKGRQNPSTPTNPYYNQLIVAMLSYVSSRNEDNKDVNSTH